MYFMWIADMDYKVLTVDEDTYDLYFAYKDKQHIVITLRSIVKKQFRCIIIMVRYIKNNEINRDQWDALKHNFYRLWNPYEPLSFIYRDAQNNFFTEVTMIYIAEGVCTRCRIWARSSKNNLKIYYMSFKMFICSICFIVTILPYIIFS